MLGAPSLLLASLLLVSALSAQGDAEAFLTGLRGVRSADASFIRASATALKSLAPLPALADLLDRHAGDPSATVRLVVLEAEVLQLGLSAYARALAADDAARAEWAIERLLEAGSEGSVRLFKAAAAPRARYSLQAAGALARLDGPARRRLLAELLLGAIAAEEWRLIADLAGLPAGSTAAELLPALYADKLLMALAGERLRDAVGASLPPTGLVLQEVDLQRLLADPVPAHIPYILATLPRAGERGRVVLARAMAALHHPDAALHFAEVFIAGTLELRTAAFAAALETAISPGSEAVLAAVLSGDQALEAAALEAALAGTTSIAPGELRPVLAAIPLECVEDVLLLLRRHPHQNAVQELLNEALNADSGLGAPHFAAEELVRMDRFTPRVMDMLTHAEWRLRCLAVTECRKIGSETTLPLLKDCAKDQVTAVRVAVAVALGKIVNDHARTLLMSLARDPEPMVREQAALGLGVQENWHIVPVLMQMLRDPDRSAANAAAVALFRHGFEDARPRLREDLKLIWLEARTRSALDHAAGPR